VTGVAVIEQPEGNKPNPVESIEYVKLCGLPTMAVTPFALPSNVRPTLVAAGVNVATPDSTPALRTSGSTSPNA